MHTAALGVIGNDGSAVALATRIAGLGHRVVLSLPHGASRPQRTTGVELAATPTDVAFECMTVILAIEDSMELRTLLVGTADRLGLAAELEPGSILIDTGARPPRETQALLGITGRRGIAIVDAALIGWSDHSSAPDALVLAGGFPDAVEAALPALSLFGTVERTGPLGSAHTAAALMGYMEAAHTVAEAEAHSVGRALGLGASTMRHVSEGPALPRNVTKLTRQTGLLRAIAQDRGIGADVIDFTWRKIGESAAKSG